MHTDNLQAIKDEHDTKLQEEKERLQEEFERSKMSLELAEKKKFKKMDSKMKKKGLAVKQARKVGRRFIALNNELL